jgi:hypothetical protein
MLQFDVRCRDCAYTFACRTARNPAPRIIGASARMAAKMLFAD